MAACDELGAVDWKRHAVDGMFGKARSRGKKAAKDPINRGRARHQEERAVDADGGPLGRLVIAGTNVAAFKLLDERRLGRSWSNVLPPEEFDHRLRLHTRFDKSSRRAAVAKHR